MIKILQDNTDNIKNYVDCSSNFALVELKQIFIELVKKQPTYKEELIFLCIGTDKVVGDSLGPLVGYKLKTLPSIDRVFVYGSLENTINAHNINSSIKTIYNNHKNPLIIAIDASLGHKDNINFINIGSGGLLARESFGANITLVGDIFIKGIVNKKGLFKYKNLSKTSLSLVINMADIIASALWQAIFEL